MAAADGWVVVRHRETPGEFHARELPDPARREVWVADVTSSAVVLGSAQPDTVDRERATALGLDVVRRRSGGGAVLVEPDGLVWVDVVVPAGDPLWQDDVGRAFLWLGEVWAKALSDLGLAPTVHDGGLVQTRWSRQVCFAGLGPGEVTLPGGGKAVGISQRRTRAACRFQCAALLRWAPEPLVDLLGLEPLEEALTELAPAGSPLSVAAEDLLGRFLHHLP